MYLFSHETLALLPLLEEVDPSTVRKTIKLRTFDNLSPPLTTAITFSRQTTLVHSRAQHSIGKNL